MKIYVDRQQVEQYRYIGRTDIAQETERHGDTEKGCHKPEVQKMMMMMT